MVAVFIWRAIEQNAPQVADYARYLASEPLLWLVLIFSVAAQTWMGARESGKSKDPAKPEPASAADVAVLGQAVTEALAAQQKQISELASQIDHDAPRSGHNGGAPVSF